jgi:hypothetical protein
MSERAPGLADLFDILNRDPKVKVARVFLQDQGQDFLWIDVERTKKAVGVIRDAGPFQGWLWRDKRVMLRGARIGRNLTFARRGDGWIKYPITKIRALRRYPVAKEHVGAAPKRDVA